MDKEQLFSIGEVARLFHMSVSSLRHYESLGLLSPEYINPDSGYRYYSTRQFEVLNTLRYLRALDMPLPEIADFLQNRDVETIEQKLRQQKAVVEQKLSELSRIERKIDHRLSQLQDAKSARLDEIELIQTPACRIVWMEDALYLKSFLDMEPSIRRLEQSQREAVQFSRYDCAFLLLDREDRFDGETHKLPETLCARIRFRGSHPQAGAAYEKLLAFLRAHHFAIGGFSREVTLIDNGLTDDPGKFVTEISLPGCPAE